MSYKPGKETGLYIGMSKKWLTDWRTRIGKHGRTKPLLDTRGAKRVRRRAYIAARRITAARMPHYNRVNG